jgi:hypothetical protein
MGRMEFHVQSVMVRQGCDVLARTRHVRFSVCSSPQSKGTQLNSRAKMLMIFECSATSFSSGADDENRYHEGAE